jgi:hypothetical protein
MLKVPRTLPLLTVRRQPGAGHFIRSAWSREILCLRQVHSTICACACNLPLSIYITTIRFRHHTEIEYAANHIAMLQQSQRIGFEIIVVPSNAYGAI